MANMIIISKRAKKAQKTAQDNGWLLVDVSSTSKDPTFAKFSPVYPHGRIPVPGMADAESQTVEGVWQGLKVFEKENCCIKNGKSSIKRAANEKRGALLGHRFGIGKEMNDLIGCVEARRKIYIPTYLYMMEEYMQNEIGLLRGLLAEGQKIAFIDNETNGNIEDISKPLSHASIISEFLI